MYLFFYYFLFLRGHPAHFSPFFFLSTLPLPRKFFFTEDGFRQGRPPPIWVTLLSPPPTPFFPCPTAVTATPRLPREAASAFFPYFVFPPPFPRCALNPSFSADVHRRGAFFSFPLPSRQLGALVFIPDPPPPSLQLSRPVSHFSFFRFGPPFFF